MENQESLSVTRCITRKPLDVCVMFEMLLAAENAFVKKIAAVFGESLV